MTRRCIFLALCIILSLGIGCQSATDRIQTKIIEIQSSDSGMVKTISSNSSGINIEAPTITSYPVYKILQDIDSSSAMDSYKKTYFSGEEVKIDDLKDLGQTNLTGKTTGLEMQVEKSAFFYSDNYFYNMLTIAARDVQEAKTYASNSSSVNFMTKSQVISKTNDQLKTICNFKLQTDKAEAYPVSAKLMPEIWGDRKHGTKPEFTDGYIIYSGLQIDNIPICRSEIAFDALPSSETQSNVIPQPEASAYVDSKGVRCLELPMIFNVSETGKSLDASKFVSAELILDVLKKRIASDDRKYLIYKLNSARIEYLAMPENMSSAKAMSELILSPAWVFEGTITTDRSIREPGKTGTVVEEIFFAADPVTGKVYGIGNGRILSH